MFSNAMDVRAFRLKWKLSQRRMAAWLGISLRQYARYESGEAIIDQRLRAHLKALPSEPPPE